jgi:hypothetical protein
MVESMWLQLKIFVSLHQRWRRSTVEVLVPPPHHYDSRACRDHHTSTIGLQLTCSRPRWASIGNWPRNGGVILFHDQSCHLRSSTSMTRFITRKGPLVASSRPKGSFVSPCMKMVALYSSPSNLTTQLANINSLPQH